MYTGQVVTDRTYGSAMESGKGLCTGWTDPCFSLHHFQPQSGPKAYLSFSKTMQSSVAESRDVTQCKVSFGDLYHPYLRLVIIKPMFRDGTLNSSCTRQMLAPNGTDFTLFCITA